MTTQRQEQENIPSGLQLYWYEINDGEEARAWWGRLAGSTHRMQVVVDELDSTRNESDISVALTRLAYHVENYFIRAYELRERVLGLLSELTGQKKAVDKLRKPACRQDALASLQPSASPLVESVTQILSFLDDDIGLRNMHTHCMFLEVFHPIWHRTGWVSSNGFPVSFLTRDIGGRAVELWKTRRQ